MKVLNATYQKSYKYYVSAQDERNLKFSQQAKLRLLTIHDIIYVKSLDKYKPKNIWPYEFILKHLTVSFIERKYQCFHTSSFRLHIYRLLLAPCRNNKEEWFHPYNEKEKIIKKFLSDFLGNDVKIEIVFSTKLLPLGNNSFLACFESISEKWVLRLD